MRQWPVASGKCHRTIFFQKGWCGSLACIFISAHQTMRQTRYHLQFEYHFMFRILYESALRNCGILIVVSYSYAPALFEILWVEGGSFFNKWRNDNASYMVEFNSPFKNIRDFYVFLIKRSEIYFLEHRPKVSSSSLVSCSNTGSNFGFCN